jgi:hypothetical protein
VAALRQLCVLDASVNRITTRGVEHLRGLRDLVRLDIGWNLVCDAGARVMASDMRQLQDLEIVSNHLTGAGVAALMRLPALRRLDARDNEPANETHRLGDAGHPEIVATFDMTAI